MKLIINHSSMQPIYEQIVDGDEGRIGRKYSASIRPGDGKGFKGQRFDGKESV